MLGEVGERWPIQIRAPIGLTTTSQKTSLLYQTRTLGFEWDWEQEHRFLPHTSLRIPEWVGMERSSKPISFQSIPWAGTPSTGPGKPSLSLSTPRAGAGVHPAGSSPSPGCFSGFCVCPEPWHCPEECRGRASPCCSPCRACSSPWDGLWALAQRELQVRAAPAADAALALRRGRSTNVQTLRALSKKGSFFCLGMSLAICTLELIFIGVDGHGIGVAKIRHLQGWFCSARPAWEPQTGWVLLL